MNGQLDKLKHMTKVEVVYVGKVFTVAKAILTENEHVYSEGIARRSSVDAPDDKLGIEIATGRALRALYIKLTQNKGKRIYHHYMG